MNLITTGLNWKKFKQKKKNCVTEKELEVRIASYQAILTFFCQSVSMAELVDSHFSLRSCFPGGKKGFRFDSCFGHNFFLVSSQSRSVVINFTA